MLGCECGSLAVTLTDAEESHDEDGNVESFEEQYNCGSCGGIGTFSSDEHGVERLTGCLTRSSGGVF